MQYNETSEDYVVEILEAMSREELLDELEDILAQGRLRQAEAIYNLIALIKIKKGSVDVLSAFLESERLTEPDRVEIILDLLKQNRNQTRQPLESHLYC